MKKLTVLIALLITSCFTGIMIFINANEPDHKSDLPPSQGVSLSPEEEILMMEEAVAEAERLQQHVDDPSLYPWLIRTIADAKTFDIDLSDDEIIKKSRQEKIYNEQFIAFAEIQYDISFSIEEVDQFVKETFLPEGSKLENVQAIASMLDMTADEFITEFERDRNTQTMVWMHVQPLLHEKYSEEMNKLDPPYNVNSFLLEKYEAELEAYYP